MNYSLTLSKEAIKELDRLDRKLGQRIQRRFDEIAVDPYGDLLLHLLEILYDRIVEENFDDQYLSRKTLKRFSEGRKI